jgi:peptidyl-prolyl cis-trans isomerase D
MLKAFRKHQKSVLSVLLMLIVCMAMLGFGVDFFTNRRQSEAISIDDIVISYPEFLRERENLRTEYQNRFGDFYYQLVKSPGFDLDRMLVDRLVPAILLRREAQRLGLYSGKEEIREYIKAGFPGGYSREAYLAYLSQLGMSAQEFEQKAASEVLVSNLRALISDVSRASLAEAEALLIREETEYTTEELEFDPAGYEEQVPELSQEELETYFEENASNFEIPPRVRYDYIVLDPKNFLDTVEIQEEDLELYYVDRIADYTTPARVKISHIQLNYPEDDDLGVERKALLERAEALRNEAVKGTDFAQLVKNNSQDSKSRNSGGSLGWLDANNSDYRQIVKAALELQTTGITEIVPGPKAYHIVQVEDFQPETTKALDEVKDEIAKIIRQREAPSFASAQGLENFDLWQKSGLSLAEFAEQNQLKIASSKHLLEKAEDPDKDLPGLTAKIFEAWGEKQLILDLKDLTILLEVTEAHDREIPSLESVKDKILNVHRQQESRKLASAAAEETLQKLRDAEYQSLKDAAQALAKKVVENKLKLSEPLQAPYTESDIKKAVFALNTANSRPDQVFSSAGKYYLFEVSKISKPDLETNTAKLEEYKTKADRENADIFLQALLNTLKARSETNIDPDLLAKSEEA